MYIYIYTHIIYLYMYIYIHMHIHMNWYYIPYQPAKITYKCRASELAIHQVWNLK